MTTGASNDLERATKIALSMIKRYGMSRALGPRTFGKREELVFLGRELSEERDYGDKVAEEIDQEVKELVNNAYVKACEILIEQKPRLVRIAEYLIEHEAVSGEELNRLFNADDAGGRTGYAGRSAGTGAGALRSQAGPAKLPAAAGGLPCPVKAARTWGPGPPEPRTIDRLMISCRDYPGHICRGGFETRP